MLDKNPKFGRREAKAGHVHDIVTRAQQATPITGSARENIDPSLRKIGGMSRGRDIL